MNSAGAPRFQLGYWKIRGLAQVPRLMFEYTGTPYKVRRKPPTFFFPLSALTRPLLLRPQDVMYEQGEGPDFSRVAWLRVRPELDKQTPFMNLPYLIDAQLERPLTESKAILLHLARVLDLHGVTEQEKCDVEVRAARVVLACSLTRALSLSLSLSFSLSLSAECNVCNGRAARVLYAAVLLALL